MKGIKITTHLHILILINLLLSLSFSGCSTSAQPKLISIECNETIKGAFKRDKNYVYVPVKDFRKLIEKCSKIKAKCTFMYKEINNYNKEFIKERK